MLSNEKDTTWWCDLFIFLLQNITLVQTIEVCLGFGVKDSLPQLPRVFIMEKETLRHKPDRNGASFVLFFKFRLPK